ncbi:hypothetical protein [Merdimmobilis hominis]|uniref:hypothetical protein n=1 Tax=Merdimmobilis hominis TaxID=2897707 RepID=UPI003511B5CE
MKLLIIHFQMVNQGYLTPPSIEVFQDGELKAWFSVGQLNLSLKNGNLHAWFEDGQSVQLNTLACPDGRVELLLKTTPQFGISRQKKLTLEGSGDVWVSVSLNRLTCGIIADVSGEDVREIETRWWLK